MFKGLQGRTLSIWFFSDPCHSDNHYLDHEKEGGIKGKVQVEHAWIGGRDMASEWISRADSKCTHRQSVELKLAAGSRLLRW